MVIFCCQALKRSQSFIANEVKNESSAGEAKDRSEQFISASKAAMNDRSAVVSRRSVMMIVL